MLYKKVVIVSSHELDKRIITLFRVEELVQDGFDIEYWNLSAITYGEHLSSICNSIKTVIINSRKDFANKVRENISKKVLYVMYINYVYKTYYCYRILSRYHADILYCINGVLPRTLSIPSKKFTLKILVKGLKNRLALFALKTPLIIPVKYELRTCLKAGHAYKIDNQTRSLPYNSTDYENTLISADSSMERPYIVFIDQCLSAHPDRKIARNTRFDANLYYRQMSLLFDKLEAKYLCKIVIAAHPASSISYLKTNPFGNRELVIGRTKELVMNSKCVIAHFSTAIYFAVIYYKPLTIISSKDISLNMSIEHSCCKAFAHELGCKFLMLDNLEDIEPVQVNVDKYNRFKYSYITNPKMENKSNKEILISIIQGDYE